MAILTHSTFVVNEVIPSLPTPEEAQRDRNMRSIVARAVSGDLADWSLDGVAGLLMLAGATWAGACMWRDIIALQRAALVPAYEAGLWWIAGEEHSQERWITGGVWEV